MFVLWKVIQAIQRYHAIDGLDVILVHCSALSSTVRDRHLGIGTAAAQHTCRSSGHASSLKLMSCDAGPNGEEAHVMHTHHDGPYSVSYTETMQQPLSPMVVGPDMQQQQHKEHHQMASHLNLHGESIVNG